jgi:hypothetical protein
MLRRAPLTIVIEKRLWPMSVCKGGFSAILVDSI